MYRSLSSNHNHLSSGIHIQSGWILDECFQDIKDSEANCFYMTIRYYLIKLTQFWFMNLMLLNEVQLKIIRWHLNCFTVCSDSQITMNCFNGIMHWKLSWLWHPHQKTFHRIVPKGLFCICLQGGQCWCRLISWKCIAIFNDKSSC